MELLIFSAIALFITLVISFGISFYKNVIKPISFITHIKVDDKIETKLMSPISGIRRIGKFQDGTRPGANAEHLCKSDFTVQRIELGKYGGNKLGYDDVIYTCPKCKTKHSITFQHGDVWKCKCGLIAQSHGNGLDVWE